MRLREGCRYTLKLIAYDLVSVDSILIDMFLMF